MIQLPNVQLPEETQAQLAQHQSEIDELSDYAARVERAQERFEALNKKGNPAFDSVKAALTKMCAGARRCAYCEDSVADEVEHIRPKALYPELVFAWMNYLYACGPCNGPKNSRFAVFAEGTGVLTNVSRQRGAPVEPPAPGRPVLIDPRVEDPAGFMTLDLRDTFWFAHLAQYIQERSQGLAQEHLLRLAQEIQTRQHPTVWREMKRQHRDIPELKRLFDAAPEALNW